MRYRDDLAAALAGMLTLAVAMGIGRFAFTPVLPMMQNDLGLTIAAGGGLAAANYIGYFAGAVSAVWLRTRPLTMIGWALAAVSVSTAVMGIVHQPVIWLALRGIAGIASAWVLVSASAWTLHLLSAQNRRGLNGVLFGGVGLGITVTGICCLVFLQPLRWSSDQAWLALGALAGVGSLAAWKVYRRVAHGNEQTPDKSPREAQPSSAPRAGPAVLLVTCYGAFGFGYIIPATFLPAMARELVPEPAVFGWAWPIFGAAAMASTLVAGRLARHFSNRTLWAGGHLVMAAGVALPVAWSGMTAIVIAALLVGGTFMVVTMTGLQEAREATGNPQPLMAAMTAAFALGQILGPMLVGLVGSSGLATLSITAAVILASSAVALIMGLDKAAPRASALRRKL